MLLAQLPFAVSFVLLAGCLLLLSGQETESVNLYSDAPAEESAAE